MFGKFLFGEALWGQFEQAESAAIVPPVQSICIQATAVWEKSISASAAWEKSVSAPAVWEIEIEAEIPEC